MFRGPPKRACEFPGSTYNALKKSKMIRRGAPRFHFLLFQAFMFIAEYQTQQIQNLYVFVAFVISGVKHRKASRKRGFSTKSTLTGGRNRLTPMKSTNMDEIRTDVRVKEDGFNFIVSAGVPRSELASFEGSRMRTISSEDEV